MRGSHVCSTSSGSLAATYANQLRTLSKVDVLVLHDCGLAKLRLAPSTIAAASSRRSVAQHDVHDSTMAGAILYRLI